MTYEQITKGWELIRKTGAEPTDFLITETLDYIEVLRLADEESRRLSPATMEILKRAIEVYGSDAQEVQAIEELSELIQALIHKRRGRKHNIAEEIADVEIMLEQLKIINRCGHKVSTYKFFKLCRLRERLEEAIK